MKILESYSTLSSCIMNATYRSEKSLNEYSLDVLKSCIAKATRRGKFSDLVYSCIEMDLFAYSGDKRGETIRTNFIHRLMIAFMEEISIANPGLWFPIADAIKRLFGLRKARKGKEFTKRDEEEQLVVNIAWMLANSKKGRAMSHYRAVYNIHKPQKRMVKFFPEIADIYKRLQNPEEMIYNVEDRFHIKLKGPEFKVEKEVYHFFVALGKQDIEERRDAVYWAFKILKKLDKCGRRYRRTKPEYLLFYILEKIGTPEFQAFLSIGRDWFAEIKTGEKFMCWLLPLLAMIENRNISIVNTKDIPDFKKLYQINKSKTRIEFDDFVFDMHTKSGKMRGMGAVDFVYEGSKVENEGYIGNTLYKDFYRALKLGDPLESSRFLFETRAQLVTGKYRTDTYFAKLPLKRPKRVFIKGPLLEPQAKVTLKIAEIKRDLGLPYVPVERHRLYPDLPKGPLGFRNTTVPGLWYPFLVFKSMITEDTIPVVSKSSKLWPETEVVDWSKVESCRVPVVFDLPEKALESYVLNLLFRWIFGIPDFADRNFLYIPSEEVVYSVDEDSWGKETNLMRALKKRKCEFLKNYIKTHPEVTDLFKKIEEISLDEDIKAFALEKLAILRNRELFLAIFD